MLTALNYKVWIEINGNIEFIVMKSYISHQEKLYQN